MDKDAVSMNSEMVEKVISELKEIESLTPEGPVKFRINNLIDTIIKVTGINSDNSLIEQIFKKMKESKVNNPELHAKLYILYRNLSEGRVSIEEAAETYESYLEMYPFDTMIF